MPTLLPKESGGDFEKVPAGTYPATCYRLIELGTQQIEWQGTVKHQYKIMLSWELGDEAMSDGRPFAVHQRYTLSASDKSKLRQDLESWRGVPFSKEDFERFDIATLIGKSCLMGIVHESKNGKTYENISSILRMPKGMVAPPLVNEPVYFCLSEFDREVYDKLSDSLKAVIAKSPEYQKLMGADTFQARVADDGYHQAGYQDDSEIPF